jgi:hypothetical protein
MSEINNFITEPSKFGIVIQQALEAGVDMSSPINIPMTGIKESPYEHTDPLTIFKIKISNFFYDNDIYKYYNVGSLSFILNKFNYVELNPSKFVFLPQTNKLAHANIDATSQYCVVVLD